FQRCARRTAAGTARPATSARIARTAKRVPVRDDIAADEAAIPARSNKTILVVVVAVLAAGAAALAAFFLVGK
ncbi:MAG: hypothetical protein WBV96_06845, partial [Polyangia bacterium]